MVGRLFEGNSCQRIYMWSLKVALMRTVFCTGVKFKNIITISITIINEMLCCWLDELCSTEIVAASFTEALTITQRHGNWFAYG